MEQMTQARHTREPTHPQPATLHTFTLEALIKAISEELHPGEDRLVAEILLDLLDTGRIRPVGLIGESVPSMAFALVRRARLPLDPCGLGITTRQDSLHATDCRVVMTPLRRSDCS